MEGFLSESGLLVGCFLGMKVGEELGIFVVLGAIALKGLLASDNVKFKVGVKMGGFSIVAFITLKELFVGCIAGHIVGAVPGILVTEDIVMLIGVFACFTAESNDGVC
mmetsp:Transcript_9790/g.12126  ORF Transcript_9790/g.12126 Transcript_9790/m.12126 type:complete len:108 (-) Transcript_9790:32-355(-)